MKKVNLIDTICPVSFDFYEDKIFYFDKLNKHEGVFCLQEGNKKIFLKEVFDNFGVVRGNKLIYYNLFDGKTNLFINDFEDEKSILLDGIFFDFKFDDDGNLCCLGSSEEGSVIQIFNHDLKKIKDIYITELLFCSSFEVVGEDIFAAGFDKDNFFKIVELNYYGRVQKIYNLNYKSNREIVANFFCLDNYIIIHATGKIDKIIFFDLKTGKNIIVNPKKIGLKSIADMKKIDDRIVLLDKNSLPVFNVNELLMNENKIDIKLNIDILKYKYLLYSTALKNNLKLDLPLTIITAILIPFIFKIGFNIRLMFELFGINYFIISSINNFFQLKRKSNRIEALLDVFKRKTYFTIIPFVFLTYFSSVALVFFKLDWRVILIFAFATYGDYSICKTIKNNNVEYSVELLEYNNEGLRLYLKDRISELLNYKSEKVEIKIKVKSLTKDYIKKWKNTREVIVSNGFDYKINENEIQAQIDFNKRDIKYSRYSILMDFITFIKESYSIDEIKIQPVMIKNREKS